MYNVEDKVKVIAGKYKGMTGTVLGQILQTLTVRLDSARSTVYVNVNDVKKA